MSNTILLNGGVLNGSGTPSASPTLPAASTGITFELSNVTLVPMGAVTCGIEFTVYGDMKGLDLIPDATGGILFTANATPPITLHTLNGSTGITFSLDGDGLSLLRLMSGATGITLDAEADLGGWFHVSGSTGIELDTTGTIFAYRRMSGTTGITFTTDAELWVNPDAGEDEDRTFRRPMTTKEFRRE